MRIVFGGTPDVAIPSLDALLGSRHKLAAVVTRPDAPSGRGKKLAASPVARRAAELGIEVLKPQRPRDDEFVSRLTQIAPDCCPVVAYGALLPQRVLDIPRHGWVNLHFSLLPAWRGAAPVQHAILAGDQITGATTFRIVLELDAGPIFATVTEPIRSDDTAGDLLHRLSLSGARLLVATLDGIEDGTLTPTPQPETDAQVSYASKINVEDARIDWTRPAEVLDRLVRACAPAPGAWTTFRGERFKINSAHISDNALPPGVLDITKRSVRVGTGTRALQLGEVQAQGKKPMTAADWARGVTFDTEPKFGA
ncbi:MAG TPA: methionyl-tRNA formyltransferase [Candidatus Limnocylindria bacterium]|nr:methionyl-tRNA formyltransferase [Candidatus Limnocylindria bacterium]